MNHKWTQWLSHKWRMQEKGDTQDLIQIAQWLRAKYGNKIDVRREWFLFFSKVTYQCVKICEKVSEYHVANYKIRCPDILVLDRKTKKILFVIELDGLVHDRKLGKTWKRNADYELAAIPMIVLNKQYLEMTKQDLFTYLQQQIEKLNIKILDDF